MKLLNEDKVISTISVGTSLHGQCDEIVLNRKDMEDILSLPAHNIHDYLGTLLCRYGPKLKEHKVKL